MAVGYEAVYRSLVVQYEAISARSSSRSRPPPCPVGLGQPTIAANLATS